MSRLCVTGVLLALCAACHDGSYSLGLGPDEPSAPDDTSGAPFRGIVSLISGASDGTPANRASMDPALSADGRFVAFASDADNLVPGDSNGTHDVFVRDRLLGTTVRVSQNTDGTESNGASYHAALSPDGRFAAFSSFATNLGAGASGQRALVYVAGPLDEPEHFVPGVTAATPASTAGSSLVPSLSNGASLWTYLHSTSEVTDVLAFRPDAGEPRRLNVCDGVVVSAQGGRPVIDAAERLVVFDAWSDELSQIFAVDLTTGECRRVIDAFDGGAPNASSFTPSIDEQGRRLAFVSQATNLTGEGGEPDDRYALLVRDLDGGTTRRIGVEGGSITSAALSGDGRYLAFVWHADRLEPDGLRTYRLYVQNLETGRLARILEHTGDADWLAFAAPRMSRDGRVVVFMSSAPALTPDDTNGELIDVFAFEFSELP